MSAAQKIVSNTIAKAKGDKSKEVKAVTVRIVAPGEFGIETSKKGESREIRSSVLINGQFAPYGAIVELLEHEAADLILRGRAELLKG